MRNFWSSFHLCILYFKRKNNNKTRKNYSKNQVFLKDLIIFKDFHVIQIASFFSDSILPPPDDVIYTIKFFKITYK